MSNAVFHIPFEFFINSLINLNIFAASLETKKEIKSKLNIKYGQEQEHVYDIFGIDLDTSK